MWRLLFPFALMLLTAASAPNVPNVPDMAKVGEAAAKIGDPATVALYFSLVLNVVLILASFGKDWRMQAMINRFSDAAAKLGESDKAEAVQLLATLHMIQQGVNGLPNALEHFADALGDRLDRAVRAAVKDVMKDVIE